MSINLGDVVVRKNDKNQKKWTVHSLFEDSRGEKMAFIVAFFDTTYVIEKEYRYNLMKEVV